MPAQAQDQWLDERWDCAVVAEDEPMLPPGCVPYLPCPVASLLDIVHSADMGRDDVVVDLGAGIGRALALVHWLTGARGIGVEIQPGLVRAARMRAATRGAEGLRFIEGDAADAFDAMRAGTVFFMYCPFGLSRVRRVLKSLQALAKNRELRICCVNMPSLERAWLEQMPSRSPDVAVYRSMYPVG